MKEVTRAEGEVELRGNLVLAPYSDERALELVTMWRASFERGVGVLDPHSVADQLTYLRRNVLPENKLLLALEGADGPIVAFIAFSNEKVSLLYVHVDYQRRGIGKALLDIAKRESSGRLHLFTFARNLLARSFYEKHGFREIGQGFEAEWQLADVEYEWVRSKNQD